eukprot:7377455-Prymnesium_polylepis.2
MTVEQLTQEITPRGRCEAHPAPTVARSRAAPTARLRCWRPHLHTPTLHLRAQRPSPTISRPSCSSGYATLWRSRAEDDAGDRRHGRAIGRNLVVSSLAFVLESACVNMCAVLAAGRSL